MERVSLTLQLTIEEAKSVLEYLGTLRTGPQQVPGVTGAPQLVEFWTGPKPTDLRYLLNGRTKALATFFVEKGGGCFNWELAKHLQLDDPTTSAILGKVTSKLKQVGIDTTRWYAKSRRNQKTYLQLRGDVLELFRQFSREAKE